MYNSTPTLGTHHILYHFSREMDAFDAPTPRAAFLDTGLSRSSPRLYSPRLASSNTASTTARRQSANAGDGHFEKLVMTKLTAAMAQRAMDNSESYEERAHYHAYMHKSKSSLALFSHCDQEVSQAVSLLKGQFSLVSPKLSKSLPKTKK